MPPSPERLRSLRSFPIPLALLSLLIIVLVAADSRQRLLSGPSWVVGFPSSNNQQTSPYYYYHDFHQRRHSLLDACRPSSRSQLRYHIEMIRRRQQRRPFPPPPPPPLSSKGSSSSYYEIDPRYGVEKRLVPSGPNPLHN